MVETNKENLTQYLLEGEKINKIYDLGILTIDLYKIVLTDRRMIVIKKFPKNVIELNFKNIELVEYYTNVEWMKLIFSILFFILITVFIVSSNFVLQRLAAFLPPVEPILEAGPFLGMKVGMLLVLFLLGTGALYYFGFFINSLFGRLRIIIYEQAPLDIITPLTPDVTEILKNVETVKSRSK